MIKSFYRNLEKQTKKKEIKKEECVGRRDYKDVLPE